MGIVNRRNAALGWVVWRVAKRVGKRKAKDAVPGMVEGTNRPNKGAIALMLAALAGALTFWKKRSERDDDLPPE